MDEDVYKKYGWGDKAMYDIPMTQLNFYFKGECITENGIDSFSANGQEFKCDDVVVVGGHIGNIETVNLEKGICMVGLSYEYDKCMADPYDWDMWSGYRCKIDGIRHATEEEKAKYQISANLTCDAAEASDRAYKEKRERMLMGCYQ